MIADCYAEEMGFFGTKGKVVTTVRVRVVEINKKDVVLSIEGHEIKVDHPLLNYVHAGPNYDSQIKLRVGNSLELPHELDIEIT